MRNAHSRTFAMLRGSSLPLSLSVALSLLLAGGCGDDDPAGPDRDSSSLVAEGWREYEEGDWVRAADLFAQAVAGDPDLVSARVGEGWSRFHLAVSPEGLRGALASLEAALARDSLDADAMAGRAAVGLALGSEELPGAIASARKVLDLEPAYAFDHQQGFRARELRLIVAFAHAARGEWSSALAAGEEITPSALEEGDPASWEVDGVPCESWGDAVLAFLQFLAKGGGPR
jgi:hypothetical protein